MNPGKRAERDQDGRTAMVTTATAGPCAEWVRERECVCMCRQTRPLLTNGNRCTGQDSGERARGEVRNAFQAKRSSAGSSSAGCSVQWQEQEAILRVCLVYALIPCIKSRILKDSFTLFYTSRPATVTQLTSLRHTSLSPLSPQNLVTLFSLIAHHSHLHIHTNTSSPCASCLLFWVSHVGHK